MPALSSGQRAPDIELNLLAPAANAGARFSLAAARKRGPVLAAFFKVSCPVCQFAFPYLERMFQAYPGSSIVGVSQNLAKDTAAFARQYGITFPIALDDPGKYPASNAYGLTTVPSIFFISQAGAIEVSSVGWAKSEMQQLNDKLAAAAGKPRANIFRPGENVPDFKPG